MAIKQATKKEQETSESVAEKVFLGSGHEVDSTESFRSGISSGRATPRRACPMLPGGLPSSFHTLGHVLSGAEVSSLPMQTLCPRQRTSIVSNHPVACIFSSDRSLGPKWTGLEASTRKAKETDIAEEFFDEEAEAHTDSATLPREREQCPSSSSDGASVYPSASLFAFSSSPASSSSSRSTCSLNSQRCSLHGRPRRSVRLRRSSSASSKVGRDYISRRRHYRRAPEKSHYFDRHDILRLNISGTAFHVRRSTLENDPLVFQAVRRQAVWLADRGEYFLEHDAVVFRFVHAYLRFGCRLHLPGNLCGPLLERELASWGIPIGGDQVERCCLGSVMDTKLRLDALSRFETFLTERPDTPNVWIK